MNTENTPIDIRENKSSGPAMMPKALEQSDWAGLWFIREHGYEAWVMVIGASPYGEVYIKCLDPDDVGSVWVTPSILMESYERSRDCISWQSCVKWEQAK